MPDPKAVEAELDAILDKVLTVQYNLVTTNDLKRSLAREVMALIQSSYTEGKRDGRSIASWRKETERSSKIAAKEAIIRAKVASIDSVNKAEFDHWCSDEMERIYPTLEEIDDNVRSKS